MNSIKRRGILEKLYGTLTKYSTLKSSSRFRKKRDVHVENLLQTRIRNFLEKNGKENNHDGISRPAGEFFSQVNSSNPFCQGHSLRYNQLLASIEIFLHREQATRKLISLRTIDDECCKLLGVLSAGEIFNLLHSLMRTGINIATLKLYKSSLLALRKNLERDCLGKEEILQLLFFEGLAKKLAKKQIKLLLKILPPLQDLSLMEKIVVAHTTFKCSVKLESQDARSLEKQLERNASELVEDPPILSTICKALSYAGTSDEFSLDNLDRGILGSLRIFSIIDSAHILSLYAQANQQNSKITQRLFSDSMSQIIEDRNKVISVRIKDVDRLVWASSLLNHVLNETHKEELTLYVQRRYREFAQSPYLLINTLLALWMLNCRLYEIIDKCLSDRVFEMVKAEKKLWKRVARLHLLLVCVKIEWPERSLPRELFELTKVEPKVLKPLKKLCRLIEQLENELGINEIKIDCPVEGIYIAGISFAHKEKSFHVDLLNETTCFKATEIPHGLTNLKLRLLGKIGYFSILVNHLNSLLIKWKIIKTHGNCKICRFPKIN